MPVQIEHAALEALGGKKALDKAIKEFSKALADHSKTEGVPAPTAHPFVEKIVRNYAGKYTVLEPATPNVAPELPPTPGIATVEEAPELTFEQMQGFKLWQLAGIRRQSQSGAVEYAGYKFWGDTQSQLAVLVAKDAARDDPKHTVKWKTIDGQFPILEADDFGKLLNAMRANTQLCFNKESQIVPQITALKSLAALKKFDVQAAWDAL